LVRNPETARQGFNVLVRKYQAELYRVIRRLVKSHADTDDLLQQTFLKAWNGIGNFRGDSALGTWLHRIATNEALGYLRRSQRRPTLSLDDDSADGLPPDHRPQLADPSNATPSPEAILELLQAALDTLPERQRVVFCYRYYDEKPYEEIADILGVTVGALKASYHHAAKKIEHFLTTR
jgi:RNA polymerase sigma-70 factor (ECF subfamily)